MGLDERFKGQTRTRAEYYSTEQNTIYELLYDFDSRIGQAYSGAIHVLYQDAYPDKLIHFAHSLREVIDQLAKLHMTPKQKRKPFTGSRSESIKNHLSHPSNISNFDDNGYLDCAYDCLSSVAHHGRDLKENNIRSEFKKIEEIFKTLGTKPILDEYGTDHTNQNYNTDKKHTKKQDKYQQGDDIT